MGREIRMVPPNWEHPKVTNYDWLRFREVVGYQPMYDRSFKTSMQEWYENWQAWERGERPEHCKDENKLLQFWDWDSAPPRPEYYRPDWPAGTATWYQVYETVSEGTPVTPPFATQQELIDYLVKNGDFWDQERRKNGELIMNCDPWPRQQAEKFVLSGMSAPSMVVVDGRIMTGVQFVAGE